MNNRKLWLGHNYLNTVLLSLLWKTYHQQAVTVLTDNVNAQEEKKQMFVFICNLVGSNLKVTDIDKSPGYKNIKYKILQNTKPQ